MTTKKKKNVAAAPSRPTRAQRTSGAFLGTAEGTPRRVRQATVHNWVELVYKAFSRELPKKPGEVALLVLREADFAGGNTYDDRVANEEAAGYGGAGGAVAGVTREADRFVRVPVKDKKGRVVGETAGAPKVTFNDLLYVVWVDDDAAKLQRAEVYRCTVDPGGNEDGTSGTPYQLEGHHYKAYPRDHKGESGALSLYSSAKTRVVLAREKTKMTAVFANIESALVPAHGSNGNRRWLFCNEESNDTIHIHWSGDYGDEHLVKRWSTGCTVLMHARGSEHYQRFRSRFEAAPNKQEIPYLIVATKYVRTYDQWAQALVQDEPSDDPARVIKRDGLTVAPLIDHRKLYVPSFVTAGFLESVEAKAKALESGTDKSGTAADAAALREAARRICIDTLKV